MFDSIFDDDDAAADAVPGLRIALRIRGDSLDPDFITLHLGVGPTLSARHGDPRDDSDDAEETGRWALELAVPPGTELGDGIDMLLARVPNDATLWEELVDAYAIDVHCLLDLPDDRSRPQTTVDAAVLERLARLRLPLRLEFVIH